MKKQTKWRDRFDVHPSAAAFPEMSDAEIKELGADIKKHGLKEPILVRIDNSGKETLIDGRSRLDAMELTGIELKPEHLDIKPFSKVENIPSLIVSLNAHRRHLSKGTKAAIIVAAHLAAENLATMAELPEADEKSIEDTIKDAK